MQRLSADDTYILLSRQRRLLESIDHWLSAKICFIAVGLLEKAKRIFQYRVFRLITIAVQSKGKRRIVAHMEATVRHAKC